MATNNLTISLKHKGKLLSVYKMPKALYEKAEPFGVQEKMNSPTNFASKVKSALEWKALFDLNILNAFRTWMFAHLTIYFNNY